jgi:hypothetical protein
MPHLTEAEDAIQKMEKALKRLSTQIVEQGNIGNTETAERFSLVAAAGKRILDDIKIYVQRFPEASKADLKNILESLSRGAQSLGR